MDEAERIWAITRAVEDHTQYLAKPEFNAVLVWEEDPARAHLMTEEEARFFARWGSRTGHALEVARMEVTVTVGLAA